MHTLPSSPLSPIYTVDTVFAFQKLWEMWIKRAKVTQSNYTDQNS